MNKFNKKMIKLNNQDNKIVKTYWIFKNYKFKINKKTYKLKISKILLWTIVNEKTIKKIKIN